MCRRLLILSVLSMILTMALATTAAPAVAQGKGNSEAAHLCKHDGYRDYTDVGGNRFTNTGDCVSYAAQGGELQLAYPTGSDLAALLHQYCRLDSGGTTFTCAFGPGVNHPDWGCISYYQDDGVRISICEVRDASGNEFVYHCTREFRPPSTVIWRNCTPST